MTAHLSTVSCGGFTVTYAYTPDGLDAGYAVACANGTAITRTLARDPCRREWVTGITNAVNGIAVRAYALTRDPGGRVTARNGESYAYNGRGELAAAVYPNATYAYMYDSIGIKRAQSPSRKAQGDRDFKATPKEWSEERYPATQRQLYIVAYVDSTGAVSAEYEYDPFGKVTSHTGMDFDFQFSTKFYDPDIDMYYYGYRYYSPGLRRWASRDPIGEAGGLNLYGFCGNVPISFIDTNGMFTFADFKGKPDSDSFFSAKTVYEFNYDNNPGEIIYEVVEHSGESCKTALKFGMINGEQGYYQDPQCPCEKCYTSRASYSKYTFSVTFIPEKSWVRHPNIDGLLRHENMHLFIAQKTAKEESEKLTAIWGESNVKYCDKDRSKHYAQEALLTRIAEKYKEIQKNDELVQIAFDAETEHGMNREEEEKWEKKLGYR